MDKTYSIMLDLLRFGAANMVLLHHAEQILKDKRLSAVASFGHDSVIFFFILSGFVIGFVSTHKEKNISDYMVARAARLYSVAIPSLMLVYALFMVGLVLAPGKYGSFADVNWFRTIASCLLFLNETWLAPAMLPTNGPYWSISHEAWYYVIFALAFYMTGVKKYVLVVAAAALAGPKILVLMPIWILGYAFYKVHGNLRKRRLFGYAVMIVMAIAYLAMRASNLDDVLYQRSTLLLGGAVAANEILGFSKRFLPDFVTALMFLLLFYGLWMVKDDFKSIMERFQKPIRFLSGYSFSIYLFHYPLLVFWQSFTDSTLLVLAACAACIAPLGWFSESRKHQLALTIRRLARV